MSDPPKIEPNEFRYFLYSIDVELDLDAQFRAIEALLAGHRAADQNLTDEIDRLADRARKNDIVREPCNSPMPPA